jgi:hypothetical protein
MGESQNTFSWTGWMEKASRPWRPLLYVMWSDDYGLANTTGILWCIHTWC